MDRIDLHGPLRIFVDRVRGASRLGWGAPPTLVPDVKVPENRRDAWCHSGLLPRVRIAPAAPDGSTTRRAACTRPLRRPAVPPYRRVCRVPITESGAPGGPPEPQRLDAHSPRRRALDTSTACHAARGADRVPITESGARGAAAPGRLNARRLDARPFSASGRARALVLRRAPLRREPGPAEHALNGKSAALQIP
jgi:hypothetical protein